MMKKAQGLVCRLVEGAVSRAWLKIGRAIGRCAGGQSLPAAGVVMMKRAWRLLRVLSFADGAVHV